MERARDCRAAVGALVHHRFGVVAPRRVPKGIAHLLLRTCGRPLAAVAERVVRLSSRRVGLALIYHGVRDLPASGTSDLVRDHAASLFEQQIGYLSQRYRVIPASQLVAAARTRRRRERFPVAVTFDDDLTCHATVALPVLRRAGVPATFFLSGASLKTASAFWWERLQRAVDEGVPDVPALVGGGAPGARYTIHELGTIIEAMDPDARDQVSDRLARALGPDSDDAGIRAVDVRALASGGMEIGFHTLRHDPLPYLDDNALARALSDGRDVLEDLGGNRITTIAYPHGRADARVAHAAREAGFETGFAGQRSPVGPRSDPLLLGRLGPSYRSVGHFALQIVRTLVTRPRPPSAQASRRPGNAGGDGPSADAG